MLEEAKNLLDSIRSLAGQGFTPGQIAADGEDLKIDGEWIDLAADWAFMVPIVEMASSPRHIEEPLYLYEPAVPKDEGNRQERDSVISRILDKDRYARMC